MGVDTRTGVDDNDYQPPFRFTGKLDKLTIKLDPSKMTADEKSDTIRKQTQDCHEREPVRRPRVTREQALR